MTVPGSRENLGRPLSTADLASAARGRDVVADEEQSEFNAPGVAQPRANDSAALSGRTKLSPPSEAVTASNTRSDEALVALFPSELTETYRSRWVSIQSSFVDDPRQAVRSGDELVAEIMTNLANTFADERHKVEDQLDETGAGSTENLRLALRRYRSFFERLLTL
jgi:hypothetical protein